MTGATSTALSAEVVQYAAAVRAALADVPPERSEELLDDLEGHLAEVASDGAGSLVSRLGPPDAYAAELRTAAGLPAGPAAEPERVPAVVQLVARLRAWEPTRQVEAFLPELRPAWWVLRAWAAVTAVDVVFVGGTAFPLPTLGLGPIGFGVTVAAIVWSVRLGLRARAAGRDPGRVAVLLNAGLAVLTLVAVVGLADRRDVASADPVWYGTPAPSTLVHEDGTPISNILPYSSTGEPLTGVLLYDQDGRPIDDLADSTPAGEAVETADGAPVQPGNAYPQLRQVLRWGTYGEQLVEPMPLPQPAPSSAAPSSVAPSSASPSSEAPIEPTPSEATPSDATPSGATPSGVTPPEPTPSEQTP